MTMQLTIANPHCEKWIEARVKATGKSRQDVVRDLVYATMMSEVAMGKTTADRVWGGDK